MRCDLPGARLPPNDMLPEPPHGPVAVARRQSAGHGSTALDALAAADAVHIADGVVAAAYPFSGIPTPHRVELDGLPAVYAMCAIDALGLTSKENPRC